MQNVSNRKGVLLVLLDLSAAFDTVNHSIMLYRLTHDIGVKGAAKKWFKSYLSGRTTCICIDGSFSDYHSLNYGLPQGSIVGPSHSQFTPFPLVVSSESITYNITFMLTIFNCTYHST